MTFEQFIIPFVLGIFVGVGGLLLYFWLLYKGSQHDGYYDEIDEYEYYDFLDDNEEEK